MVVTTQWPLKRAAHLTSLVWVCVLWLPWKLNGAICAMGSNWQQPGTSLDNGLALNRRQAIIWTNADPFHWRIYAALGGWWVKVGWGWWFKLIKQPCRHCQMNFSLINIPWRFTVRQCHDTLLLMAMPLYNWQSWSGSLWCVNGHLIPQ